MSRGTYVLLEPEDSAAAVPEGNKTLPDKRIKGKVALLTRSGLDWTDRFGPAVMQALAALPVKATGGKRACMSQPPVQPRGGWDAVKGFARAIAQAMEADSPDLFIARSTKSVRKGRIYVDYLRNGRGATAIAPYSTRAREGATVSMPLAWDELEPAIGPDHFTVTNARARLGALSADPWGD